MIRPALLLGLAALTVPNVATAQTPPAPPPPRPAAAAQLTYRGFAPGMAYREFAARAQALAHADTLRCQTMRRTANVMDCGVRVRDPADGVAFYLSANVIDGKVSVISFLDSGAVAVVARAQRDLERRLGSTNRRERSMWEWSAPGGRRFVRLNWRGRGTWRVVSITLNDRDVMDRIARYRPAQRAP